MDSAFESKLKIGAAIGAVVLTVLATWYWQRGATPDAGPAAPPARAWDGPVGPGLASGAQPDLPSLGARLETSREPGLATDAGGHLVPGLALRKLMDSWLAPSQGADRRARAGQLRAWLRHKLAAPSADEADRIVTNYLGYLETEGQLLARERFSAPGTALSERDVERLLAWQDQRAQRRQRALGPALALAWFEADDSRCGAVLRDWQLQHVAPDPAQEPDPVELRERRIHGAALEARRDYDAQRCAAQMIRGDAAGG
jgi:hypothetical protein